MPSNQHLLIVRLCVTCWLRQVHRAAMEPPSSIWLGNIPQYLDEEGVLSELACYRVIPLKIRYRTRGGGQDCSHVLEQHHASHAQLLMSCLVTTHAQDAHACLHLFDQQYASRYSSDPRHRCCTPHASQHCESSCCLCDQDGFAILTFSSWQLAKKALEVEMRFSNNSRALFRCLLHKIMT